MVKTLISIALLLGNAQWLGVVGSKPVRIPGTYTFYAYTYVVGTGAGSPATITSPAVTLTAGDFVFMKCSSKSSPPALSSTPSNTFTLLTGTSSSVGGQQAGYVLSAAGGSTTFTCTIGQQYQDMIVLLYHHSGTAAAVMAGTDVSVGNKCTGASSCTSGSYTVATYGLAIFCAEESGGAVFTAGAIGPGTGTLRGVSGATLSTSSYSGCEDYQYTVSALAQTSQLKSGSSANWNITGAIFN